MNAMKELSENIVSILLELTFNAACFAEKKMFDNGVAPIRTPNRTYFGKAERIVSRTQYQNIGGHTIC